MFKKINFMIFAIILLFSIPTIIAPLINNPTIPIVNPEIKTTESSINYSLINGNNSQYLQGYTPFNLPYLTSESDPLSLASINGNMSAWLSTYNSTYDLTSKDVTANRTSWTSTYNSTYQNLVNQNCPTGQVVNGTFINGSLKCTSISSSGDNSSWNESRANTLYVPYLKATTNVDLNNKDLKNVSSIVIGSSTKSTFVDGLQIWGARGWLFRRTAENQNPLFAFINSSDVIHWLWRYSSGDNNFDFLKSISGGTDRYMSFIYTNGLDTTGSVNFYKNINVLEYSNVSIDGNEIIKGHVAIKDYGSVDPFASLDIKTQAGLCSGTPANNCSDFATEEICNNNDNHGGNCYWGLCENNPLLDCTVLDESTCGYYESTFGLCVSNMDDVCGDDPALDCSTMDETTCTIYQGTICNNVPTAGGCEGNEGCDTYESNEDCSADIYEYGGCYWADEFAYCENKVSASCGDVSIEDCPIDYGCSVQEGFSSCSNAEGSNCDWIDNSVDCDYSNLGCVWDNSCNGNNACTESTISSCQNESCDWDISSRHIKLETLNQNDNPVEIYSDGINMIFNTSNGIGYFSGNVSATGFITRTSIFDKTTGTAMSKIKDATAYINTGAIKTINETAFYGYTKLQVTDYSKPVDKNICIDAKNVSTCKLYTTYPFTKEEKGVDLGKEVDVCRQALSEIKDCTAKSLTWEAYQLCIGRLG